MKFVKFVENIETYTPGNPMEIKKSLKIHFIRLDSILEIYLDTSYLDKLNLKLKDGSKLTGKFVMPNDAQFNDIKDYSSLQDFAHSFNQLIQEV